MKGSKVNNDDLGNRVSAFRIIGVMKMWQKQACWDLYFDVQTESVMLYGETLTIK